MTNKVREEAITYLLKMQEDFEKVIEAPKHDIETIIQALKDLNRYIIELKMLEEYTRTELRTSDDKLSCKVSLDTIKDMISTFRLFNQSLTAILRAETLIRRYNNDLSQLEVKGKNRFGILYYDPKLDCYLIYDKRSGFLDKFNKPYLTRRENQAYALKLFEKMKIVENTN